MEFETLPHTPGVIYFWVVRREIGSKAVQYSKAIPFYFTSADEAGKNIDVCVVLICRTIVFGIF